MRCPLLYSSCPVGSLVLSGGTKTLVVALRLWWKSAINPKTLFLLSSSLEHFPAELTNSTHWEVPTSRCPCGTAGLGDNSGCCLG